MAIPNIPTIDPKERALAAVYRRLYQKALEAEAHEDGDDEQLCLPSAGEVSRDDAN